MNVDKIIVDTGVPLTANGISGQSLECVQMCVRTLKNIVEKGHIVLDGRWIIVKEYMNKLSPSGQPGIGDSFLKWVLTNMNNPDRCTYVPITPKDSDPLDFEEFPSHPGLKSFDRSDRKFVAASFSHGQIYGKCPPIFNGGDCKWWGWKEALKDCHIHVEFLCPDEVKEKYEKKIKSKKSKK